MQEIGTTEIIVAVIGATTALALAVLQYFLNKKISETHREVSVNGGKNNPPTLKDEVGALRGDVQQLTQLVGQHMAHAAEMDAKHYELAEVVHGWRRPA